MQSANIAMLFELAEDELHLLTIRLLIMTLLRPGLTETLTRTNIVILLLIDKQVLPAKKVRALNVVHI